MKMSKKVLSLTLTVALVACLNWSYLGNLWSLISSAALGMASGQTVSTAALQAELENLTLSKLLRFDIVDFDIENFDVKDFLTDIFDDIIKDDDLPENDATTEDVAFEDTTEEEHDDSVTEHDSNLKPSIVLKINSKQLGKKWGKHKYDYPELDGVAEYEQLAKGVFNDPDKIILDSANNEYLYIRDNDLLRIQLDGSFVSVYPGVNSARVTRALEAGGLIWEK